MDENIKQKKERIVDFMKEDAYRPLLFDELITVLDVPVEDREIFRGVLDELESEGRILKTHKKRYGIPERMNLVTGRLQGTERGFGFVIPDAPDLKDVYISAEYLNGAMHNDRVISRIYKKGVEDKRPEGEIIRIIERANNQIVGTFEKNRNYGFVVPDDKRIASDIFIPGSEFNNARTGEKVVAFITRWPEKRRNAEGKIIESLGLEDEPGTDILSIIKSYKLKEFFPDEVLEEAGSISQLVTEEMLNGRKDLRKLRMVTIDGEDAKDLDDAVSIETTPNGYLLGVHIADVSCYVKEGSSLDKEALKRATSVYLVDRVIPMLPEQLSNGICSLNPRIDRLAFSVMMEVDNYGRVIKHDIFESVININERMTYKDVYRILEEKDESLIQKYGYLVEDFKKMKDLAMLLKRKRTDRGAIDFEFGEVKVILDEAGKPIEIKPYEITIANSIIEEFMLLCNETVAEQFFWAEAPFLYRIHEEPDIEKIKNFGEFAKRLGYRLKGTNKIHPGALQDLLKEVKGSKEEKIISTVMLRSLRKAVYSHESIGHFGLAAKFYSHFTSPIRRYPDLMIHRIMKEYIKGKLNDRRIEHYRDILPVIARNCSVREREAEDAERDCEDLKKAEYMQQHLGDVFTGIISNITSFGMFVELENTIEGLIKLSEMEDDYYIFNDRDYSLIGERSGKTYRIGNELEIIVASANKTTRQINFTINNLNVQKRGGYKKKWKR